MFDLIQGVLGDGAPERPSWRQIGLLLVIAAAVFLVFVLPLAACPCGMPPDLTPGEHFAWVCNRCVTCEGRGRITLFQRMRGVKARPLVEKSAPDVPDAAP